MSDIEDYRAFVAVIERKSLTAAARQLGRSLQSVSRSLASLERELGVELVRRTTRSSRATDAGLAFHARIKSALADIDLARSEIAERAALLTGRLRVGASILFAPTYLVPAAAEFLSRHPGTEITFVLSEQYADPVAEGLDLAIRIGPLADSTLIARRLGTLRRVAFAAPSYLARYGRPRAPAELADHDCIVRGSAQNPSVWTFRIANREETIAVRGRFRADATAACNEAVAFGLGIGIAPLWQVRGLLDEGQVELLLTDFEPLPVPIHGVWPAGQPIPARARAFLELVASRLAASNL
ncbi:LysR family transcriptional regulator [Bradyrhizobium sp.]|jgi:DNA-binding transcriptional LysR family regulator|uniref:LysR family transcriptional regulator n=1 Tax=Bradyrhizobium sp. TaxID=376 RepID=UPI002CCBB229|nr:LysR family transcriptional regulator [Bradyrhizobium sp.]HWX60921.1 LysR family transcriptional regulator [Bradyrhizobium sp.]